MRTSATCSTGSGCGLTAAEDIAAAAHHVLCIIDAEAAQHQRLLLAPGAGQPDL